MKNRVIVAGGGASGLTAAVFAAENGAEVTIIEHKDRVGKKILMTGNGKCNLTNMEDIHGKYYSSNDESMEKIYDTLVRFDADKTRAFFKKLGLYTKEKRDGGVYPVSEQAATVLDVLRSECSRLGVHVITDCEIKDIIPDEKGGKIKVTRYIREIIEPVKSKKDKKKKSDIVSEKNETVEYDKLILATGGMAASVSGSDGSGYELAKKLGHSIIEPLPALVQLKCSGNFFKAVAGVRAWSILRLYVDGKYAAQEEGELQLTDYGISGIPVFQFSRVAARALYCGSKCDVRINFMPYIDNISAFMADIERNINDIYKHKTVEEVLAGFVHKKLSAMICRKNAIGTDILVENADKSKILNCIKELFDFNVHLTGTNSFENAQVCSGGVSLLEVDENFNSYKCRDVYIIGELLDCDGICGGYNLQWAWATGAIAGKASAY